MSTEEICATTRRVLERHPPVQAAYLFGSHASGRASPDSDVDLALAGPGDELRARVVDILVDLTAEGLDHVDIVLLDDADTVLRFEAVHHNVLVYARPGFDHGAYFSRSLREYFDFEPYLRRQRKAMKERLLHGQG